MVVLQVIKVKIMLLRMSHEFEKGGREPVEEERKKRTC